MGRRLRRALDPYLQRATGRRTRAFVLSGGGSLGAVQVGMLRALVEAGVRPDLVIGCSVGAINGAGFAADPTLRGVARMERIWRRMAAGNPEVMPGGFMPLAVQLARRGQSLHDPRHLAQLLTDELPASDFSQLKVPFQCVATDLKAASEHWFTSGPLVPALMASASLPAVFPACEIDGRTLIDGGVLNEIHTHRAVELGATELWVLHVGHLADKEKPVQRPFDSALRAYWTARRFRFQDDLRRIPGHCAVHVVPAGATPRLRFDDFTHASELIEAAYDATSAYLVRLDQGHDPGPDPSPVVEPVPAGLAFEGDTDSDEGDPGAEPATAFTAEEDRPGL